MVALYLTAPTSYLLGLVVTEVMMAAGAGEGVDGEDWPWSEDEFVMDGDLVGVEGRMRGQEYDMGDGGGRYQWAGWEEDPLFRPD